ncbi:MBL fold metallo-hydrolase [candidate division KSB1 bacterium]
MKKAIISVVLLLLITAVFCADKKEEISVTILYDNYLFTEGLKTDWGFACLINGTEKTILFDTGRYGETFLYNIDALTVNPQDAELTVLSHFHDDHVDGLIPFLGRNSDLSIYMPVSFPDSFKNEVAEKGAEVISVTDPVNICKNVYLTGEMGAEIKEQAIILDTEKGVVLITGCAHPGIVDIIKRTKEVVKKDIYLVCGGFHLSRHSEDEVKKIISEFKELGVMNAGPTHCTGKRAIELFKEAYGENFVQLGAGRVLMF